jgi:succinoglycan biosynthesis transport protein ExoP
MRKRMARLAMETHEKVQTMGAYAAVLRRRWLTLATIIPSSILIAVFLAYTLPPSYRSSATILLEPSSIPPELIKTTVISYADQQIELVQRTVMTPERLASVVQEVDPYPALKESARAKAAMIIDDTTIEKVDPVTLEPAIESPAFTIYYDNADRDTAIAVNKRIAKLFLNYNRETRAAQAREAYNFLLAKSKELTTYVSDIEKRIADFKAKYGDALPESRVRNEQSLDRVQRDIDAADVQIRMLEQQESLLALQLKGISPTIVASSADIPTQLGLLRAELAAAQQKYTPDHPDVKRLKHAIEALAEQAKVASAEQVVPDNPDYLRVSTELQSLRGNLAAWRSTAARARAQLADYERRLTSAPGVERDYAQLERDRQLAQEQLIEIRNKLQAAGVAQTLEAEAMGERYTLIREASSPSEPYSPNRLGLILVGVLLGCAIAVGLAAFRESADPSVRSANDVAELSDLDVIGAIPKLLTPVDRRRQHALVGSLAGGYLAAIAIVVIAVISAP